MLFLKFSLIQFPFNLINMYNKKVYSLKNINSKYWSRAWSGIPFSSSDYSGTFRL